MLWRVSYGGFGRHAYNVDKVALIKRDIYLIRLNAMDSRDKILDGHFFFDNKPLIVKPWTLDIDFEKEEIEKYSSLGPIEVESNILG